MNFWNFANRRFRKEAMKEAMIYFDIDLETWDRFSATIEKQIDATPYDALRALVKLSLHNVELTAEETAALHLLGVTKDVRGTIHG